MRHEKAKFKMIVDRARMGHLTECTICGELLSQPLSRYFEGMTYRERLENGDEMLRHLLETAGFNLEEEPNIGILTFLAHDRGGHSSYKAKRVITHWASKGDQDWMDGYGERERQRFEHIREHLDSLDLDLDSLDFKEKK